MLGALDAAPRRTDETGRWRCGPLILISILLDAARRSKVLHYQYTSRPRFLKLFLFLTIHSSISHSLQNPELAFAL